MQLTKGQASDYQGAALLMDAMDALPEARALLADRADDAGWFRDAPHPARKGPEESLPVRSGSV